MEFEKKLNETKFEKLMAQTPSKKYGSGILGEANLNYQGPNQACDRYGCNCINYERQCCIIV